MKTYTNGTATNAVINAMVDAFSALKKADTEVGYALTVYGDLSEDYEIDLNQQEKALLEIFEQIPFESIMNLFKKAGYR